MEEYPGLSRWTQYNHKSPKKWNPEAEESVSEWGNERKTQEPAAGLGDAVGHKPRSEGLLEIGNGKIKFRDSPLKKSLKWEQCQLANVENHKIISWGCFKALWMAYLVAQMAKNLPAMQETQVQSRGGEDPVEKKMATHSSILAWKIPKDRGTWWPTVHGVTKSQTQLSDQTTKDAVSCYSISNTLMIIEYYHHHHLYHYYYIDKYTTLLYYTTTLL